MNSTWDIKHPMPPKATIDQRIKWHITHTKYCACRPIPISLRSKIRAKSKVLNKYNLSAT